MKIRFTLYQHLAIALLCLACIVQPAYAQQSTASTQSALAVSPAIIEKVLEPGKPTAFSIQVSNVTNFPLPIKGTAQSFTLQSTDLEKTEAKRLDAAKWFVIEEPDFILQPKQVRTVKGVIQPPADAIPGGHYATLFFQPLIPAQALSPSTAQLNAKVGVLAFMIIKGDITQEAAYVKRLQTDSLIRRGPATFQFSLHNSGNVHLFPNSTLTIFDLNDKKVASLPIPPGAILPNSTKEYSINWDAANALGKYRGELEVSYGDQNISLPKSIVVFWIFPWLEIVTTVIILGALILFVFKTRRRWHKAWQVLRNKDS